jgi:hypothetical protein
MRMVAQWSAHRLTILRQWARFVPMMALGRRKYSLVSNNFPIEGKVNLCTGGMDNIHFG